MRTLALDWICTVDEDTLHAARKHAHGEAVVKQLWRRLEVKANSKALLLELSQVNEDNIHAPGSGLAQSCFGFSWEDLEDKEFLCKMIAHEQFCVASRVLRTLDAIKRKKDVLLLKLKALESAAGKRSFSGPYPS